MTHPDYRLGTNHSNSTSWPHLDCDWVVGAPLDSGIVGNNCHQPPMHRADACHDPTSRDVFRACSDTRQNLVLGFASPKTSYCRERQTLVTLVKAGASTSRSIGRAACPDTCATWRYNVEGELVMQPIPTVTSRLLQHGAKPTQPPDEAGERVSDPGLTVQPFARPSSPQEIT